MVKVFFYIQNNALRWFLGCCWMLWDALLPSWGARGREFESRRPDQFYFVIQRDSQLNRWLFFCLLNFVPNFGQPRPSDRFPVFSPDFPSRRILPLPRATPGSFWRDRWRPSPCARGPLADYDWSKGNNRFVGLPDPVAHRLWA